MEYFKEDRMTVLKNIDNLLIGDKLIKKKNKEIVEIINILREDETPGNKTQYRNFMFYGFNVYKKGMAKIFEMSTFDQKIKTVI